MTINPKEFNTERFSVVKTTVGCLLIKDNKVLLEKRNTSVEKGKWAIPGGHIDIGETAEEAIKREIKEETDLEIKNLKFLAYQDEFMPHIKIHSLVLIFKGEPVGEVKLNDESSEFGWFTKEEALKLNLAFFHKDILTKFFNHELK
jgi:8-oxo-dGTP diphosphatase